MGEGQPEYWASPGETGVPDPQGEKVIPQMLSMIKNDKYSWIWHQRSLDPGTEASRE